MRADAWESRGPWLMAMHPARALIGLPVAVAAAAAVLL